MAGEIGCIAIDNGKGTGFIDIKAGAGVIVHIIAQLKIAVAKGQGGIIRQIHMLKSDNDVSITMNILAIFQIKCIFIGPAIDFRRGSSRGRRLIDQGDGILPGLIAAGVTIHQDFPFNCAAVLPDKAVITDTAKDISSNHSLIRNHEAIIIDLTFHIADDLPARHFKIIVSQIKRYAANAATGYCNDITIIKFTNDGAPCHDKGIPTASLLEITINFSVMYLSFINTRANPLINSAVNRPAIHDECIITASGGPRRPKILIDIAINHAACINDQRIHAGTKDHGIAFSIAASNCAAVCQRIISGSVKN
ncbi:hypothetical protein ACRS85_14890 [Pluralibacter gergoviae]|uniref:hypothetical protein n=1 Tax=Pluralibacter gergoviae TaxID=61647 RepID=UPI003EE3EAC3